MKNVLEYLEHSAEEFQDKIAVDEENAIHYPFNGRSVYDCLCCKGTGTLARIPAGREVHTRKIEHHVVFYCGGSAYSFHF